MWRSRSARSIPASGTSYLFPCVIVSNLSSNRIGFCSTTTVALSRNALATRQTSPFHVRMARGPKPEFSEITYAPDAKRKPTLRSTKGKKGSLEFQDENGRLSIEDAPSHNSNFLTIQRICKSENCLRTALFWRQANNGAKQACPVLHSERSGGYATGSYLSGEAKCGRCPRQPHAIFPSSPEPIAAAPANGQPFAIRPQSCANSLIPKIFLKF